MMPVRFSPSSLKESRWYEYLIRFVLGGVATVFTGLISSRYGASVGGLFLALPAIFCASATLIEKHEIRRKREAGLSGERRGQMAAAVDSAGATLGALGMLAFAAAHRGAQRCGRVHCSIVHVAGRFDCRLVRATQNAVGSESGKAPKSKRPRPLAEPF